MKETPSADRSLYIYWLHFKIIHTGVPLCKPYRGVILSLQHCYVACLKLEHRGAFMLTLYQHSHLLILYAFQFL